ncbi:response regulator transcription factor [Novosphingobium kaempferiae]|uniref:response regulator transcription factor n=1 Tax=Novosphingobium kaempferiae TaxID=2896849 RepID=UPI001E36F3B4|nr:response regulator [Novosphingobium kaempferiae]
MALDVEGDPIDTAQYSILVVDDMEANRTMLARRLEKLGYRVASVDSGAAALAQIETRAPDLLLLDYMMPQMSGLEVLQRLRSGSPETADLPVIMVTARAEGETTVEALSAGADDYVTKPVDFDVLHARIRTQLIKHSGTDKLRRMNAVLDERMTLRNLTLADLEGELADEVRRRRELERELETGGGASAPAVPIAENELHAVLARISQRFDVLFNNVLAGNNPNLAQLAEIRALIAQAAHFAGMDAPSDAE